MAQQVKVLATKTDNLDWTHWNPQGGKEETDPHRLSTDLHTSTVAHMEHTCTHTPSHAQTHKHTLNVMSSSLKE